MKVILKQDIHELGLEGDTVDVAKGHARNYLIPKGFALEANEQNIKLMETQRKKIELKRVLAKDEAEKMLSLFHEKFEQHKHRSTVSNSV